MGILDERKVTCKYCNYLENNYCKRFNILNLQPDTYRCFDFKHKDIIRNKDDKNNK